MMILDLNQVMISTLMVQLNGHHNVELEESLLRHMVLNSIRSLNTKFKKDYGEMVIASDGRNSWRRTVFPYYKAHRRKAREESELNWTVIFESFEKIKSELDEYFPYRVIRLDGAEADDIIATLIQESVQMGPTLIISGDKDFIQLHKHLGVKQFDPVKKNFVKHDDPDAYLKEHIFRGDRGDGIPNILSGDAVFVEGGRQTPVTAKKIEQWLNTDMSTHRGFVRNRMLIDLTYTPQDIKSQIVNKYNEQGGKDRSKMFNYFITHKLKNLMENISEF
jgi:hypothetical protein